MQIFQRNILNKYIEGLDNTLIDERYKTFFNFFLDPERQANILNSKEEQFQEGFLRELFVKILGYTLNPDPNFNLTTEKKNETNSKKADGAILVNGKVVGVIELKDHKTPDLSKVEAQAFNYKSQHKEAVYVIISNFEKLRFYIDNAVDFEEFDLFHLTKEDFARLWICLAYDNITKNLPKQIKAASLTNEDQITNALYKDYSNFKRDLFDDILKNNSTDDTDHKIQLFKKTQKLLDRLLFFFFAEDRGLLPPNYIMLIIEQWEKLKEFDAYQPFYDILKKFFGYMNTSYQGKNYEVFAYNGGLFKPDEILDGLTISDEVLMNYCKKISDYDFLSDVDVNILGHIFENSLTEIEEITNKLQHGEAPTVSKRKKDGVFYTPQYITKYIVENTVCKLCAEKRTELGIDESEYFADKKRQVATKKVLIKKLDAYRDWLLQITICDPACGSGAFLNAALNFLIEEHKLIDEMAAKVTGATIVFPNVENSILENNLYGVDINEESVEIAKLSLWLRTAKPHRKLSSLNDNIKCGNSLIDDSAIAGDKAFNWQTEFPKVFERGGFDVVIGNPPYVLCQPSNTDERTLDYYKTFEVASYKIDLFHLFFEKGLSLLTSRGMLSYITPNTYLTNKYIKPLRHYILQNTSILSIVDHDEKVFEDASVDVATIVLRKGNTQEQEVSILHNDYSHLFSVSSLKKQSDWINDTDNVFNIKEEFAFNFENCITLGKISKSYFGIQAYDRKTSISNEAINDNYLPIIDGEDVQPYCHAKPTKYFNYLEENIKSGGDWSVYSQNRIVIRQIGVSPVVGLCEKNILSSNTMYSIYDISNQFDILYLLAILNSNLMKRYWLSKYSDSKQLFPKIKGYQLKELPIYITDNQQPIINLAKQMLTSNEQLQHKRQRFIHRLQESLGVQKITAALERFDEADFAALLAELKKQKISLTLVQKDEWEDYFTQYKAACDALTAQIAATDKEIDQMVYQLYGLTEDEIKVVEG